MVNTRGEAALVRPRLGDVVFSRFVTRDTAWCGPRDVMNDTRWCEHQPSPTTWQGWEDLLQCLHVALPLCWDQGCWWPTVTPLPPWPRLYTRLPHLTSAAGWWTRWPPASTTSDDLTSHHSGQTRELPPPATQLWSCLTQWSHCIFLPVFFSLIYGRKIYRVKLV